MTGKQLTAAETTALGDLERAIEKGLATFIEVGSALAAIKDRGLYRETHSTFEDYCRERWGMSRSRAYQLMDAAEVAGTLSTMVDTPPSERVARELAPLKAEPEVLQAVMAEAVEKHGEKPTARQVREVVRDRARPSFPRDEHVPTRRKDEPRFALTLEQLVLLAQKRWHREPDERAVLAWLKTQNLREIT